MNETFRTLLYFLWDVLSTQKSHKRSKLHPKPLTSKCCQHFWIKSDCATVAILKCWWNYMNYYYVHSFIFAGKERNVPCRHYWDHSTSLAFPCVNIIVFNLSWAEITRYTNIVIVRQWISIKFLLFENKKRWVWGWDKRMLCVYSIMYTLCQYGSVCIRWAAVHLKNYKKKETPM